MQNSDPPLAVGPGSAPDSYTVFAILFCGTSFSQYLAQLSYDAAAKELKYLKRTAVSPVTYGPQRLPKTVRVITLIRVDVRGWARLGISVLHAKHGHRQR